MAGKKCLQEWINAKRGSHCVICNEKFVHPVCKHSLLRYALTSAQNAFKMPLGVKEGSTIPDNCLTCEYKSSVKEIMEHVESTVSEKLDDENGFRSVLEGVSLVSSPGAARVGGVRPSGPFVWFPLDSLVDPSPRLLEDRRTEEWAPRSCGIAIMFVAGDDRGESVGKMVLEALNSLAASRTQ